MTTAVENGYKVCRITLVNNGSSDSVIKVYPAEHEEEKLWLHQVRDGERWEMIKSNMERYCERGSRVPKPAPYHADPKNLMNITLKEDQVPMVRMEGWVLPKPPPEPRMPDFGNAPDSMLAVGKRFAEMENKLNSVVDALTAIAGQMGKVQVTTAVTPTATSGTSKIDLKEQPKTLSGVMTQSSSAAPSFSCCNKSFVSEKGLFLHQRKMHKEG